MGLNNIENQYRDGFYNYETPIDTDEIWANIEGELEEKKKRRFIFWWFFGGLLLVGLGSYFVFFNSNIEGSDLTNDQLSTPTNNVSSQMREDIEICDEIEIEPAAIAATDKDTKENTTNSRRLAFANDKHSTKNKHRNSTSNTSNSTTKKGASSSNTNSTKPTTSTTAPTALTAQNLATGTDQLSSNNTVNDGNNAADNDDKSPNKETNDRQPKANSEAPQKPIAKKKPTAKRPNSEAPQKPTAKKKPSGQFRKKRKSSWSNYFGIYGELGLPLRQLSSKDGTGDDLLLRRKESEKTQEAFGFGVEYQLRNKSGLLLSTGLHYQQITEKLSFLETKTETIETNTVVSYTVNALQDSIPTYGIVTAQQTVERNKTTYNRYKMLNFPLGIGGRIPGKKLNIDFVAGLDFNFFYKAKGEYLVEEASPAVLGKNYNKASVGMGLWAGLTLDKNITEKIAVTLNPYIKQQVGSLTKADYTIRHRYTVLGMRIGLRFKL